VTAETLWTDPDSGRRILRSKAPSPETIAMLDATVWGSRSSRYRILGVEEKLRRLRDPSFFTLHEADQEISVIVLDFCRKSVLGRECGAYHFVMAATAPERRNEGLAATLLDAVKTHAIETVVRPGLGFALVEATTEFSLRLSDRIGHAIEATVPLTFFTRFGPRDDPAVQQAAPEDAVQIVEELQSAYADHELADFPASVRTEEYFLLWDGGRIVAGAQAELLRWSVVEIPGIVGWLLLKVVPRIPFLRRLIDLNDLRIVRLSNLLVRAGEERAFTRLAEALLARRASRIGLIMLDVRSPVLDRIRSHMWMGLLSRATRGAVKIRIDVVGMDAEMIAALSSRPLLVSAADVI